MFLRLRLPVVTEQKCLFSGWNLRQLGKTLLKIRVARDIVAHCSVCISIIGGQIEEAGASQAKENRFGLAGFFAVEGFIDCRTDRMADSGAGRMVSCLAKKVAASRPYRYRFHITISVKFERTVTCHGNIDHPLIG